MADNLEVLKGRLARGEISQQEYETLRKTLEEGAMPPSPVAKKKGIPGWGVAVVLALLGLLGIATVVQDGSVSQQEVEQVADWFNRSAAEVEEKQKNDPQLAVLIAPTVADVREDGLTLNYIFTGREAEVSRADIDGYYAHFTGLLCEYAPVRKVAGSNKHTVLVSIGRFGLFDQYPGPASDWNERKLVCPN